MRTILTLTAAGLAVLATPTLALTPLAQTPVAQTPSTQTPYGRPYGSYPGGAAAAIADQHRYETERLRAQAQSSADLARQQQVETQLRLRALQDNRAASPTAPAQSRPLYSLEQERALRDGAAARRDQTARGLNQIDAWLDRPR